MSSDEEDAAAASLAVACLVASREHADIEQDLVSTADDPRLLLKFLRQKKNDIKAALESLKLYHRYMRVLHDIPDGAAPPRRYPLSDAATLIDLGLFLIVPAKDADGRLVVVCSDISLAQKMMQENSQEATSRAFSMLFWELGESDDAQLKGISFVQDMSKYSMFQMRSGMKNQQTMMKNEKQKKAASMSMDAIPLKYGSFFIVDAPWYFSVVWALIRPFMKKKLRERVQFIGRKSLDKLHAAILPHALPPDLGGSLDVDALDKWWWVEPARRPPVAHEFFL